MAYRDDVTLRPRYTRPFRHQWKWLAVVFALINSGCSSSAPPQETVNRGRVIDQDTGRPIPGVVVVGTYRGSVRGSGATSCNRVESAISDPDGWFELPLDPDAGPLSMEGYHRDYRHGWPVRVPVCGIKGDGNASECQVWQQHRDNSDRVVSVVKEPTIYHTEADAAKAARYRKDLYLRRFEGTREERLQELWRLPAANSCMARPKTSPGLLSFLEAIRQEQMALGDSSDAIRSTTQRIEMAKDVLPQGK